jgi:hypothetical protein
MSDSAVPTEGSSSTTKISLIACLLRPSHSRSARIDRAPQN